MSRSPIASTLQVGRKLLGHAFKLREIGSFQRIQRACFTCNWADHLAAVLHGDFGHCLLAVHVAVGHDHGRVVFVHHLPSHAAHQLGAPVLGSGKPHGQLLELGLAEGVLFIVVVVAAVWRLQRRQPRLKVDLQQGCRRQAVQPVKLLQEVIDEDVPLRRIEEDHVREAIRLRLKSQRRHRPLQVLHLAGSPRRQMLPGIFDCLHLRILAH
mmetsp:Transcript_41781/g.108143  ORF Transcript_41781/g.108143 Transcript_41781/m.108143 type:complete len:211 (-) Transcript_41781:725-1357(-)